MIALELRFPGGHYHATPWGHHVNEALVEWPPSPWRLLRALMATGYTKLGWTEMPIAARALFERLASVLPAYALPRATLAHSRHYLPLGNSAQETTLVIDAWANVGSGVLRVDWPVDLSAESRALFSALAENLGYLGRAESWVEARVTQGGAQPAASVPVQPNDPALRRGFEQVPLLAPVPAPEYHLWREDQIARISEASSTKQRARALAPYPTDLLSCLAVETAWLREHGWSQPPGSRIALYWRSTDALATVVAPAHRARSDGSRVDSMLFSLATPSRNVHALPSIERALPQGELLHEAAVAKLRGAWVPELTGKDEARRRLTGHRHAHIIPLDLDGDTHIDHLLVWAPSGLGTESQRALRAVRRTYAKKVDELTLAVVASGPLESLGQVSDRLGAGLRRVLGPSRVWVSRTPFVAPRFLKPRGKNQLAAQIAAELASRGLEAVAIEVLSVSDGETAGRFRHFVVHRRKGAPPPQAMTWRIKLTFAEPVRGPLCLGYGSHFGLGSFEAVD